MPNRKCSHPLLFVKLYNIDSVNRILIVCLLYRKPIGKMNILLSLNNAFLTNRNIFTEVSEFEPKANHSPNFLRVMQWLKESVQMQKCAHIDEVETYIHMKLNAYVLIMRARITKESCIMTDVQKIKRN